MNETTRARIEALLGPRNNGNPESQAIRRNGLTEAPASFNQRAIWLAHVASPSGAYNVISAFHIRGSFGVEVFGRALNRVSQRHDILHTSLHLKHGDVIQTVEEPQELQIHFVDLTSLSNVAIHQVISAQIR